MADTYSTIVGMEIHVELKTASKMFCGCANDPFHAPKPNMYTCPVCLGMPGGLPVPNGKAVEWTIMLGLALGCEISHFSKFDRKNYFYPDLAKGYQISQYDQPLCKNGLVHTESGDVRINRVHLEEDTGKLQHTTLDGERVTLVDFNRSGVPLVEIVTEPDIRTSDQAKAFLKKLHQIVRYLDISNADLEKGSMRLEPNISVREGVLPDGWITPEYLPKYKVEVKNINSFTYVKKAIDFEVDRHIAIIKQGAFPKQETRGYVEDRGITVSQRSKEEAADYRYFPEPDIPPMRFTAEAIERIGAMIPELPDAKTDRFKTAYGLSDYDASILCDSRESAAYFEGVVDASRRAHPGITPKMAANAIINKKVDSSKSPEEVATILAASLTANEIGEDEVRKAVSEVLAANPKAVDDFKSGKTTVIMFLLGGVKRLLKGKGDAKVIEDLLKKGME